MENCYMSSKLTKIECLISLIHYLDETETYDYDNDTMREITDDEKIDAIKFARDNEIVTNDDAIDLVLYYGLHSAYLKSQKKGN